MIWLLFGILEALLGLRFIFKLIGANPTNAFANFLYTLTDVFLALFASLTQAPSVNRMVLEISTLIAMVVYALVGWVLERAIYIIFYRPREGVESKQTIVEHHSHQSIESKEDDTQQTP